MNDYREVILNKIEGLINSGKTREGFVRFSCLCEAHGMAMLAHDMGIITDEELRRVYNGTILCILGEEPL